MLMIILENSIQCECEFFEKENVHALLNTDSPHSGTTTYSIEKNKAWYDGERDRQMNIGRSAGREIDGAIYFHLQLKKNKFSLKFYKLSEIKWEIVSTIIIIAIRVRQLYKLHARVTCIIHLLGDVTHFDEFASYFYWCKNITMRVDALQNILHHSSRGRVQSKSYCFLIKRSMLSSVLFCWAPKENLFWIFTKIAWW